MMSQQRRSKQSNKTEKKDLYDIENCDEELTEEESSTRVGSASPSSPQRPVFDRMAKDTQRQLDGSLTSSTRKNRLELALAMCDDGDDTGEDASKPSTSSSSSEDKEKEEVQHHPNASSKKQEPLTTDSCFKRTTFQRAIHRGDGSEDESSEDDEDDDVPGALAIRGMGRNGLGANNDDEAEEAATVLYSMGGGENSNDGDNDNEGEEEPIIAKESNNEHLVVAELAPDIEVVEGTPMDGDEGDHNVLLMRRQQRRIRYLWISTLLAIIAVAILVGVFVAKNNNDDILSEESTTASTTFTTTIPPTSTDEEPNATNGPSTFSLSTTKPDTMQPSMDPTTETLMSSSPTILPSLAPTTSPSSTRIPSIEPTISLIPTTSSAPTTETMAKAMTMLSPYIPDVPRTAIQRQALDWLIQNDDGLINSTDEEQQDDNNNNNSASHRLLDRYVLAILYYSTHGEEWEDNTFWLSEVSVCTWYIFGFIPICPQVDGRVDNLDFSKYLLLFRRAKSQQFWQKKIHHDEAERS